MPAPHLPPDAVSVPEPPMVSTPSAGTCNPAQFSPLNRAFEAPSASVRLTVAPVMLKAHALSDTSDTSMLTPESVMFAVTPELTVTVLFVVLPVMVSSCEAGMLSSV